MDAVVNLHREPALREQLHYHPVQNKGIIYRCPQFACSLHPATLHGPASRVARRIEQPQPGKG